MKSGKFLRRILVIACALTLVFSVAGKADFGSYSGNSDYGGSYNSGGDGGGSYSGGDYGGSFGSGVTYGGIYGSPYDDDSDSDFPVVLLVTAVIVVFIVFRYLKGAGHASRGGQTVSVPQVSFRGRDIASYTEVDPDFDVQALSEKLANLYVQMQQAWTAKDIESVRPFFTDAFFAQMQNQLNQLIREHRTNYVESIAVLSVEPKTWYQEKEFDHIEVRLTARITDYTLDDDTKQLVSGSRDAEKFMVYQWDLSRKTGVRTEKIPKMRTVNCPNCGAPVSINATAKCPYCGSVITVRQEDWAICAIRGISQTTGHPAG